MDYKTANDRAPLQLPEGTQPGSRAELYPSRTVELKIKDVYTKDGDGGSASGKGLLECQRRSRRWKCGREGR